MQARLRAQLGDRSKYSGERRRRSVVVASIVLTITDPLRGSYPFLVLSPSCAHSLLRSFIRLHGVNHNQPFPTATGLHEIFTSFTIFIVFQCFRLWHVSNALTHCRLHRNIRKACHKRWKGTKSNLSRPNLYPCAVLKERFLYSAALEHTGVRWHIVGEPHVTTHYGVMPYPHPAQY